MQIIKKMAEKNNDTFGKGPATIAFLGDSVTRGSYESFFSKDIGWFGAVDAGQSYSAKLRHILNYLFPSAQINIINSGIGGDNAVNGLSRFERDITPFSPDLVVIAYALNDCSGGMDGLERYKNAIDGIIKKTKALGAECIVLTPNAMNHNVSPYFTDEHLISTAKMFMNNCLEEYANAAKEAAEENGVPVCDVYSKWKLMRDSGVNTTELLANKLNHPTREMHWLTAMMLAETIFEK